MGKRITQLDAAGPLTGAEKIPMVQEGRTVWAQADSFSPILNTGCQCTLVNRGNSVSAPDLAFEEYLQTFQAKPNTLRAVGDWIEIVSFGTLSIAVSSIFLEINNGAIYHDTTSTGAASESVWELRSVLTKINSTEVKVLTTFTIGGSTLSDGKTTNNYTKATVLTTQAIDISVGSYGLSSAGDVVCESFIIRLNQIDTNS